MRRSLWCGVALAVLLLMSTASASVGILPDGSHYLSDQLIIKLNPNVPQPALKKSADGKLTCNLESLNPLVEKFGIVSIEPFYKGKLRKEPLRRVASRLFIVRLDNPGAVEVLSFLRRLPELELAELQILPNPLYTPNDPYIGQQWYLQKIRCFEAWDIIRGDTTKIAKVGIVDSGVDWEHPDLEPNLWINEREDINHNGRFDNYPEYQGGDLNYSDDDGNGFEDDVIGYDLAMDDPDPREGYIVHGTGVAGVASAATDNSTGIAGVAFSGGIMCIKTMEDPGGFLVAAYEGIIYAADNDADVINCSWGSQTYSQAEQEIITAAYESGSLVVAAAGANGSNQPFYPAAYEHAMAVTPTDQDDHKAYFADYGDWIDICAPGINIYTTWGENTYTYLSGTSFSGPVVAGVALLVKTQNPHFTPDELEYRLEITAVDIDSLNPGYQGLLGAGRVDAYLALFPLEIKLFPEGGPIVIPPEGGHFRFSGYVYNPLDFQRRFDAWTVVAVPRPDTTVGPMELVQDWPIAASDSAGKRFRQSVPRWAPSGTYAYIGYVGEYPDTRLDSSFFTFEKLQGPGQGGDLCTSWELVPSEVDGEPTFLPKQFSLSQNYPNPFNVSTTIQYQLPVTSFVKLAIYDLTGHKVATLVNRKQEAGNRTVLWDATGFPSGVYFYRLTAGDLAEAKRMLLVK
jgi:subtilisin family serine protease